MKLEGFINNDQNDMNTDDYSAYKNQKKTNISFNDEWQSKNIFI